MKLKLLKILDKVFRYRSFVSFIKLIITDGYLFTLIICAFALLINIECLPWFALLLILFFFNVLEVHLLLRPILDYKFSIKYLLSLICQMYLIFNLIKFGWTEIYVQTVASIFFIILNSFIKNLIYKAEYDFDDYLKKTLQLIKFSFLELGFIGFLLILYWKTGSLWEVSQILLSVFFLNTMFLIIWYLVLHSKDAKTYLKVEISDYWSDQDFDAPHVFGYYSNQRVKEYLEILFKKGCLGCLLLVLFFLVPAKIFLYTEKKDESLLLYGLIGYINLYSFFCNINYTFGLSSFYLIYLTLFLLFIRKYYSSSYYRENINYHLGGKQYIYIFTGNMDAEGVKQMVSIFKSLTPRMQTAVVVGALVLVAGGGYKLFQECRSQAINNDRVQDPRDLDEAKPSEIVDNILKRQKEVDELNNETAQLNNESADHNQNLRSIDKGFQSCSDEELQAITRSMNKVYQTDKFKDFQLTSDNRESKTAHEFWESVRQDLSSNPVVEKFEEIQQFKIFQMVRTEFFIHEGIKLMLGENLFDFESIFDDQGATSKESSFGVPKKVDVEVDATRDSESSDDDIQPVNPAHKRFKKYIWY